MRPAPARPTLPRASARFTIALTLSTPVTCCVMPIDHTSTADFASAYMSREPGHVRAGRARRVLEPIERLLLELVEETVEPGGVGAHELLVDAADGEQDLHRAVQEGDIAARVDAEELVGHLRAEHRALDTGRHPVVLQPGLAQRVDDGDTRPALLREVQVLHEHRLCVGDIGTEEDDEIAVNDVAVVARGSRDPERLLQRARRRRVTHARRVVDVVRADEADRLLCGVVHLVGDAAAVR